MFIAENDLFNSVGAKSLSIFMAHLLAAIRPSARFICACVLSFSFLSLPVDITEQQGKWVFASETLLPKRDLKVLQPACRAGIKSDQHLRNVNESFANRGVLSRDRLRREQARSANVNGRFRIAAEKAFANGERLWREWKAKSMEEAINQYKQAVTMWRIAADRREEARILIALGEAYYVMGRLQASLKVYGQALRLSRSLMDFRLESRVLSDIGYIFLFMGDDEKALEHCNKALAINRSVQDIEGEIRSLNNIGEIYHFSEDLKQSLEFLNQALSLCDGLGDGRITAQTLLYLGYAYSDLNDTDRVAECYNKALPLWKAANDKRGETLTLIAIGHHYSKLGLKQEALNHYEQAMAICRPSGDLISKAMLLNGKGYVLEEMGVYRRSLESYLEALKLYDRIGIRKAQIETLLKIGSTYHRLEENQNALAYYRKAQPLIQKQKNRYLEAILLKYIGMVYDSAGDKTKALDYYNRSLALSQSTADRREEAYTLNLIGNIYRATGHNQKALDYHQKALSYNRAAGDPFGETTTLFNIARIHRDTRNLSEARHNIEEALRIAEKLRADVIRQDLRASYLATVRQNYELYIDILMQMHKQAGGEGLDSLALGVSEQARARTLLETLVEARADIQQGADSALIRRERELQRQIDEKAEAQARLPAGAHTREQAEAAAREIDNLLSEREQVRAQIRAKNPRYAALAQPQPLRFEEIQKLLDRDAALLEYALGDDRSYLWVVTSDSLACRELPSREEIENATREVYSHLTARNRSVKGEAAFSAQARADRQYAKASARLAEMIIAPAASEIKKKRLVIVADGALQYIPFRALPSPQWSAVSGQWSVADSRSRTTDNGQRTTDAYRPMILDHEIINLPSASVLAVLRNETAGRATAPKAVAALADPVFSRNDSRMLKSASSINSRSNRYTGVKRQEENLSRLSFSNTEAEAILAAVGREESLMATGFEASRATALSPDLSQYRIIHFATHGILDNERPELSRIILSLFDREGREQNGSLRLHEIYNMRLAAEMVVLSACETALGREIRGEGLVGLTRGFMYAGAARVVASLWKVDDAATAELMKRFYEKMFRQGLRPAEALRAAQIEMLSQRRWRAPYYWAAFIIQGDWR